MTPRQARMSAKRQIEEYLEHYGTERALEYMREQASEYIFWILKLQKGQRFQVIQGGKDERSSIALGPCVVRAASDV